MKKTAVNKLLLLLCFLLTSAGLQAQQKVIKKNIPYQQGQQIQLDLPIAETIKLSGWDRNEVALVATVNINNNTLNEALVLEVEESEAAIQLEASFNEEMLKKGRAADCPGAQTSYREDDGEGYTTCTDIVYELKVPRRADLKLETISANVEAEGLQGDNQIKSISGFIDFSWPQQQEADIYLQSVTGELYTNLDFDILNQEKTPPMVGYELKGKKGDGGPLLELETISSNIYLRKQ
ncbi:DUF4097 family beta strand repeat-containing protein [Nafulsella turpanensis]|uniref:hypothetical protein n=1 Tax=Nafulsella turpanensis TaxID=1265690 RepID=UPI000348F6BB|nr:hypothetical protein [Nafulsella turpanensis]